MDTVELSAWLRLLQTPGVGNRSARKLLAAFGLPSTIFQQSETTLCSVVSQAQAQALLQDPPGLDDLLATTQAWLDAQPQTRRFLTLGDPSYPQLLLQTEDPPPVLYAQGRPEVWNANLLNTNANRCLAVVGSRNPSPQGVVNARQFAQALAEAGLTIVSGMALGVDGAAHEGALAGAAADGLATIAVVGTGLDRVHPRQHRALAHQIAERGVLLSEFALGPTPLSNNFPQRNRIISGLSRGTLVVEAAMQSDSLITARLASEQGRKVFAISGSIHASQSHSCHALIKQGAKLTECAQDVLEELDWERTPEIEPDNAVMPSGNTPVHVESPLLQAIGHDPWTLDMLQARTGLPTPDLLAQLMALELQGQVARLPGGLFQRLSQA